MRKNAQGIRRLLPLIGFILLIPSLVVNIFLWQRTKAASSGQEARLSAVSDGDTLLLTDGREVRLRHVDTPELEHCGGQKAKDLLANLLKGKELRIAEEITDYHGRPLALVYADGNLVNLAMLASGWARHHNDTSSAAPLLRDAANRAKRDRLGIYSPRCYQTENPDNPACTIKGNIDKQSGDKRYYTPNCAQYKFTIIEKDIGESWFCREKEAIAAGFSKAATCR